MPTHTQSRLAHWTPDQIAENKWIVGAYEIERLPHSQTICIMANGITIALFSFADIHRLSGITAPEAGVIPNAAIDRSCLGEIALDEHEHAISHTDDIDEYQCDADFELAP